MRLIHNSETFSRPAGSRSVVHRDKNMAFRPHFTGDPSFRMQYINTRKFKHAIPSAWWNCRRALRR